MAGWDEIFNELKNAPGPHDTVRAKYLKELGEYTHRNTIAYYSGWQTISSTNTIGLDINDADITGFMNSLKDMDCSCGLDLILHTPGGDPNAAEAIVSYLRKKFETDIRVIVPQQAMSAGTMLACASKEIIMGAHSSLGPIDPQFNGIPAYSIRDEFEHAKKDLEENPKNAAYWSIQLGKYPAAFLKVALDAIELSSELVKSWLLSGMLRDNPDKEGIAEQIVNTLNEHNSSKTHARHLNIDFCQKAGLKVVSLESDSVLQDKVLSVHHAFMLSLSKGPIIKIIQNHMGKSMIIFNNIQSEF